MSLYKTYSLSIALITTLLLCSVALINYSIDPAGIYHAENQLAEPVSVYSNAILHSNNGLILSNTLFKERQIKQALARQANDINCAVIGSSHIMQVSLIEEHKSLNNICESLLNLGVSGGTLEDYLALSNELLIRDNPPQIIIFGVDPWSLDFQRDVRWQEYKESHDEMIAYLDNSRIRIYLNSIHSRWQLLTNLINVEYFLLSVETWKSSDQVSDPTFEFDIEPAPLFNIDAGYKDAVILPDGSLVYSAEYIVNHTPPTVRIGGDGYKIELDAQQFSEEAIAVFFDLVQTLNDNGIQVYLLMTPYHHNVWVDEESITTKALIEVESKVIELGANLDVKVLGSFDPIKVGCSLDEFYDDMHARRSCLAKIKN